MSKYINYRGEEQEEMIVRADSVDDMLAGKWRMLEPFVRCKECRHNIGKVDEKGFLICPVTDMDIGDEDYCAWGEPRAIEDERTVTFYSGDRPVETIVVHKQPTVDAEPVKHGHWVLGKELSREYIGDVCVSIHYDKCWCSECNYPVEEYPFWMYCPNCGARMDEVKDAEIH